MNYIFFGLQSDINIGNGKTVSSVAKIIESYLISNEERKIFSNIKLNHVDYTPLTPENLDSVLEVDNAIILFDEIHAIIHKKHVVHESCSKHETKGLCYKMSEFYRQVRKRKIDTFSTAQDFYDVHYQLRVMMQVGVLCEKFHLTSNNSLKKCEPDTYAGGDCPDNHEHWIRQTNWRTGTVNFLDPSPYYDMYDSYEIVKGWVSYD